MEQIEQIGSQDGHAAYVQLQAFLTEATRSGRDRLPPERTLCQLLGVSRGELRKALALAEREGQIWRHVGKGTFVGQRPESSAAHVTEIANLTNPREVMRSRLILEPELCREAARHANAADFEELELCVQRCAEAPSWRHYENWDNRFHRAIAQATHNELLIGLFDLLNSVRRAVVWGRQRRDPAGPRPDHHSHTDHRAIAAAIRERDGEAAANTMRRHLDNVRANLDLD